MKKLFIIAAIATSGLIFNTADAQISFRFHPHNMVYATTPMVVAQAPVYDEPAQVNDSNDDYYYLPDVDAYYDVTNQCYIYFDGNEWISAAYLPGEYSNYDWRSARRFEIRMSHPYMHDDFYRSRYNGHQVEAWVQPNHYNHIGEGYANGGNNGYNQPAQQNRNNGQRFDVWGNNGNSRPAQNRNNGQRFDNRDQGGYNQPAQQNKGNNQRFNNRGQGNSQPLNQNNSRNQNNRSGNEHVAQNSPQGGLNAHRLAKF